MLRQCGNPQPPGTRAKLYVTLKEELAEWPDTVAAIKLALAQPEVPAKGDTKRIGEAFSFAGAASGEGYWRDYDILVDTGELVSAMEGEQGGQGFRQRLNFFLLGNGPVENEQADDFLGFSGCMIAMIGLKTGEYVVLGNLEDPVFTEAADGGSGGDRVGFAYTLYANTGLTPLFYDADEFGINMTPAT